MSLTASILGYLNRVFDKDPEPFLALRISNDIENLTWTVSEGILTLTPAGATQAQPMTIDLSQYTVITLAQFIGFQPGYTIPYQDLSNLENLSALVLLDGAGDVQQSNGDHLYGYTNLLYAYAQANSNELEAAQDQIPNMLAQMSTAGAQDEFLDLQGTYYNVPRTTTGTVELDSAYAPRIISSVLQPACNNVGMEIAIEAQFPGTFSLVQDAITNTGTVLLYDGSVKFDGSHIYNSNITGISGGLFDVTLAFDFNGPITWEQYYPLLIAAVNTFRAGGTYIRDIILKNGLSASILIESFNVGPILVLIYDQYEVIEDVGVMDFFDDADDQDDLMEVVIDSQRVGANSPPALVEDAFDWNAEEPDEDDRMSALNTDAVGPDAAPTPLEDGFDWNAEEPDEDERETAIDSRPVGADAAPNPVEDAFDWSAEEPDEDDRMSALNTEPVGPDAIPMANYEEPFPFSDEEPDEFFINHFTNIDAPQSVWPDPWPWFDDESNDDEFMTYVNEYLGIASALVTESGSLLETESGNQIIL